MKGRRRTSYEQLKKREGPLGPSRFIYVIGRYAAALTLPVGTDDTVLRICEAI